MLSIDGKQDRAARGHAPDRIGACASARSSSCARWRRALILGTLLVACIPAGAAGWVKLLSQTAAAVQVMRARVRQAELNLSYTTVAAPIDGITGRAQQSIGSLVSPTNESAMLTTLTRSDMIKF